MRGSATKLVNSIILVLGENVLENIAECEDALESAVLVENDEPMDPGLSDRVEDGVQTIHYRARVDAGEILHGEQ